MKQLKSKFYPIIALIILLTLIVFGSMFANSGTKDFSKQEAIMTETITQYKDSILNNGTNVVAIVNGQNIYLSEVLRLQANNEINLNINASNMAASLKNGEINQTQYDNFMEKLEKEANKPQEVILSMLIKQEVIYQEAVKQGFAVTKDEAYQYELSLDKEMEASQPQGFLAYKNYTETLAECFNLTYEEYVKTYVVPVRQKIMASDKLLENHLNELGIDITQTDLVQECMNNLYNTLLDQAKIVDLKIVGN